ncbi:protein ELF4-LIKE 1-like [Aristolochia californica]|uniref:protein ELF4-LIKE 1-like n=1 Tax=Aristolochia californica TaxID=171875 RepID=UPI0035D8ADD4
MEFLWKEEGKSDSKAEASAVPAAASNTGNDFFVIITFSLGGICMTRTRGNSCSAGESGHTSMGNNSSPMEIVGSRHGGRRLLDEEDDNDGGREHEGGEEMNELWESFSKSFSEVQTVLDQNRVLIQQVNENHQSKIPDNLTKNVALIREINGNIGKVASLYSNLSANFSHVVQERKNQQRTIA